MQDSGQKPDPFKPQQPRIPGVSDSTTEGSVARAMQKSRALPPMWLGIAAGIALLLGLVVAWWTRGPSHGEPAAPLPPAAAGASANPQPTPALTRPVAPGEIATTKELAAPWASKQFDFRKPATGETVPAIVVHLAQGGYWAFSLRAPFGACRLEFVTDLETLQRDYSVRSSYPLVVDPCTRAVYDLERYGSGPNGLVRGELIRGPGFRPPVAIEVRVEGHLVLATRME